MLAPLYPATHFQWLQKGGKLGEWKHPEKLKHDTFVVFQIKQATSMCVCLCFSSRFPPCTVVLLTPLCRSGVACRMGQSEEERGQEPAGQGILVDEPHNVSGVPRSRVCGSCEHYFALPFVPYVTWAGEQVPKGQTAVCTVADFKYSLCVYKNPKVGHKPPRVVPMLTNVWFARKGPPHQRSGREVHPVVAAYRTLSRGVDGVNQMALQMRQVGRQMTWVTRCVRSCSGTRLRMRSQLASNWDFARRPLIFGSGNGKCCGGGTLPTPSDKRCTRRWRHNGGVCATFARGEEPVMNVPVVERRSTCCALHRDMAMEVCKAHGTWW